MGCEQDENFDTFREFQKGEYLRTSSTHSGGQGKERGLECYIPVPFLMIFRGRTRPSLEAKARTVVAACHSVSSHTGATRRCGRRRPDRSCSRSISGP